MKPEPADQSSPDPIGLAAADWLARRDRGLTPAEQDQFLDWLASDPRHGEWLAEHQEIWHEFDLLSEWRPAHSAEPNPDLLARPVRRTRRWVRPVAFAAAASIALGFVGVQLWRTLASPATAPAPAYERRVLADGSIVQLNRGAAVDVRFTATERRVTLLSGEAYFTVAKNPARPFLVHAAAVRVRAVGTAFNVRLEPAAVEVLVTEGRIEVTPPVAQSTRAKTPLPSETPVLVAGQRAVVPLSFVTGGAPRIDAVSTHEMARMLAWQPQLLDFSSTPLAEVVAEFNRRNRTQIVLADPALGQVPFVASFRSDSIEAFVRLLEITVGVRIEHRGPDEIVLHPAPATR